MGKDRVTLTVPARGEYARTVRMTAAELAARIGMSYDEVDDVRMAAEEAFVYACECAGGQEAVTFAFEIEDGSLVVEVGPLPACCVPEKGHSASESYAEFILRSVCDEFDITHEAGACNMRFCRRATTEVAGA
ncbi:MAG: ATP-binding protein [Actinobacteria bacterium]|nr:ATP-binding protein [Actinomycetota bacterium]